jgi:Transglycosylase SLT domain
MPSLIAGPLGARDRRRSRLAVAIVSAAAAALSSMFVLVAAIVGVYGGAVSDLGSGGGGQTGASRFAEADIPPRDLTLYRAAAQAYGVDWAVLAAIGKVECDHGRDPSPSCGREGATNSAGAGGPMQFLASTWARYGVDGNGDGHADRWDVTDAIYSAANYLHASGAPQDNERAIYAYNHARWYVAEVLRWAARYRGPREEPGEGTGQLQGADPSLRGRSPTPVRFAAGARATLAPGDGHVALIPTAAPAVVQAMVVAGNELQELRYGPGGHPDPRGVTEEDCSSAVNYVLYRSGVRPIAELLRENPLAQDYLRWGADGPGRWVSIYSTAAPIPHVFIVIAGLRLDTSHDGTDEGPNRNEDGPRWRVANSTPAWARWSVRHPPGL